MRRLALLLLCAFALNAQINYNLRLILFVANDPSGSCTPVQPMQYNTANGKLWGCDGTWTQVGGGGGVAIGDTISGSSSNLFLYTDASQKLQNSTLLKLYTGTENMFVGVFAGEGLNVANSAGNIGVGHSALYNLNTGLNNVAFGSSALTNDTTGYSNIAIGPSALTTLTSGYGNIAIGPSALYSTTTGFGNVALGSSALFSVTTGQNNFGLGSNTASNVTTGNNNVAIGYNSCSTPTTGGYNVCIGPSAGPTGNPTAKLFIDDRQTDDPIIGADFTARTAQIAGLVSKYNLIATAGPGVVPVYGTISLTGQTGSISTATLCAAAACTGGQYKLEVYVASTATCATPGLAKVALTLAWTDDAGAKSVTVPLNDNSALTLSSSLALGDTTSFATATVPLFSTGAQPIQYATTLTACTSGTATYSIRLSVVQLL